LAIAMGIPGSQAIMYFHFMEKVSSMVSALTPGA
jgi:hypothetical protein